MHQLRALFAIAKHGPLSVSGLAEMMGASLASTSSLAERLVKADYVSREADPTDRRKVLLVVTGRGQEIGDRLAQRAHDRIDRLVRAMTPEGREALEAGLTDLVHAAAEVDSGEQEPNHGGAA